MESEQSKRDTQNFRTISILRDIHLEANTAYMTLERDDPLVLSLLFIINLADDEIRRLDET